MEIKKLVKGLAAAGFIAFAGNTFAANQGSLGGTSTGDIDIDVTVGDQIQVTALQDITGSHVPGADFTGSSTACVYTNNPTGNYDVTMTSSNPGAGNVFQLSDGATDVVYNISYNDGNSSAAMLSGQVNTTFDNADTASTTCGGTPQSSIDITVPAANLDVVGAGTYSDVVTILVSPR